MALSHNHNLNKSMLVKANWDINQYYISIEVARKILEMMDSGPLQTKTLRNFLPKQFRATMRITSVMVYNVKVMVKLKRGKYGNNI